MSHNAQPAHRADRVRGVPQDTAGGAMSHNAQPAHRADRVRVSRKTQEVR
ncbi:hypothetical protein [Nocardia nova]